jgi:hypothetical protein
MSHGPSHRISHPGPSLFIFLLTNHSPNPKPAVPPTHSPETTVKTLVTLLVLVPVHARPKVLGNITRPWSSQPLAPPNRHEDGDLMIDLSGLGGVIFCGGDSTLAVPLFLPPLAPDHDFGAEEFEAGMGEEEERDIVSCWASSTAWRR